MSKLHHVSKCDMTYMYSVYIYKAKFSSLAQINLINIKAIQVYIHSYTACTAHPVVIVSLDATRINYEGVIDWLSLK